MEPKPHLCRNSSPVPRKDPNPYFDISTWPDHDAVFVFSFDLALRMPSVFLCTASQANIHRLQDIKACRVPPGRQSLLQHFLGLSTGRHSQKPPSSQKPLHPAYCLSTRIHPRATLVCKCQRANLLCCGQSPCLHPRQRRPILTLHHRTRAGVLRRVRLSAQH